MANKRRDKPLRRVTVSVDPDDYAAMEHLAETGDVTTAWLIRRAMREFLGRHGDSKTLEVPLGPETEESDNKAASG
jgi:hypothetical protein